jgi:hypothetical protein
MSSSAVNLIENRILDTHQTNTEQHLYIYFIEATDTQSPQKERLGLIKINSLLRVVLKKSLDVVIERDGDSYIAYMVEIPIYSNGEDIPSAVEGLKQEIDKLWDEIKDAKDLSDQWRVYRDYLRCCIEGAA